MQIRTILAAVSGGTASAGVTELACRLARGFGSHVEGLHVRLDPRQIVALAGDSFGTPLAGDFFNAIERDSAQTAARARATFDAAVRRHELLVRDDPRPVPPREASACWRETQGYGSTKISGRARLFDLLVLGRSGRVVEEPYTDAIEQALLTTGRPVLVAPAEPPTAIGEVIAVAWNDSPEAAAALSASMPLLEGAREIQLLSIGETGASDLAQHLAWYGIRATLHEVLRVDRAGDGELLLAAARDYGADLLVMGGYGHPPWREALFGGATREVVATSLLPLLIAH